MNRGERFETSTGCEIRSWGRNGIPAGSEILGFLVLMPSVLCVRSWRGGVRTCDVWYSDTLIAQGDWFSIDDRLDPDPEGQRNGVVEPYYEARL